MGLVIMLVLCVNVESEWIKDDVLGCNCYVFHFLFFLLTNFEVVSRLTAS